MTDHTALIEALERAEGPDEIATLVEELREGVRFVGLHDDNNTELFDVAGADEKMSEAAATITALQAEVAALREALEPFARAAEAYPEPKRVLIVARSSRQPNYYLTGRDLHIARAALERTKP